MDWLLELKNNVDRHGIRWGLIFTLYAIFRRERRNHLLNLRDHRYEAYFQALLQNDQIIMNQLGVGDKWKDGPKFGFKPTDLPNLRRFFLLSRKVTILRRMKAMERLKSRKFWMAILAVIIPVINNEFGINLDTPTIIGILSAILGYIAVQGHVDAKKVQNGGSTDAKPTGDSGAAV